MLTLRVAAASPTIRLGVTLKQTRSIRSKIPPTVHKRQSSAKPQVIVIDRPDEISEKFRKFIRNREKTRHDQFQISRESPEQTSAKAVLQASKIKIKGDTKDKTSSKAEVSEMPDTADQKLKSIQEHMWREVKVEKGQLLGAYMKLAKARLTGLVVSTALAGYVMAPGAFDPVVLACCVGGTALVSSAANGMNQWLEVPYDSQMNRTRNRPVVTGLISPLHAVTFSAVSAVCGLSLLSFTSGATMGLGLLNLGLYTMVYTPSKRISVINTWLGAVVGAIPPMMGWAAATGTIDAGALLLGGLLFAWQFPHFNALSWNLRGEYSRAGYPMMSVTRPDLCRATTLRYSVVFTVLCLLAAPLEVSTWTFAVDSLPFNLYLVMLAANFYRKSDSSSARRLFQFSLVHLPAVLFLLIISKNRDKEQTIHSSIDETSSQV